MKERSDQAEGLAHRRLSLLALVAVLGFGPGPVHGQNMNGPDGSPARMNGWPSFGQSTTAMSEEQLRQLKQGLLSLAMQRKARVAASGWTNSSGTLHEDVMVFSELKLEKLRPMVVTGRYGGETTKLQYADEVPRQQCSAQSVRPQRLGVAISLNSDSTPGNHNLSQSAAELVIGRLHNTADQGALTQVAVLVEAATSSSDPTSEYHHFMTAGPLLKQDMRLQVAIAVTEDTSIVQRFAPFKSVRASKRLGIEFSLVTKGNKVSRWQQSFVVASPREARRNQLAWLELPEQSKTAVDNWLTRTLDSINGAINCYGETAISIAASGSQATLQGGRDIGIYPGQRLAILPTSNRMRDRGLQSSLSVMGLAEVVKVGPHRATVRVYAGPAAGDFAGMMAMPMSALSP